MKASESLQVQIFQDTIGGAVNTETIEHGAEIFRAQGVALDIVNKGRKLCIPQGEEKYILTDMVDPRPFGSDLGVLVTRRALLSADNLDKNGNVHRYREPDGTFTIGMAYNGTARIGARLAIVYAGDDATPAEQAETTAHELGHLISVKTSGETYDGDSHCVDEQCIMFDVTNDEGVQMDFCTECNEQIQANATQYIAAKRARAASWRHPFRLS